MASRYMPRPRYQCTSTCFYLHILCTPTTTTASNPSSATASTTATTPYHDSTKWSTGAIPSYPDGLCNAADATDAANASLHVGIAASDRQPSHNMRHDLALYIKQCTIITSTQPTIWINLFSFLFLSLLLGSTKCVDWVTEEPG